MSHCSRSCSLQRKLCYRQWEEIYIKSIYLLLLKFLLILVGVKDVNICSEILDTYRPGSDINVGDGLEINDDKLNETLPFSML